MYISVSTMIQSKGLQDYLASFFYAQCKIDHKEKMEPVFRELLRHTRCLKYTLDNIPIEETICKWRINSLYNGHLIWDVTGEIILPSLE
jgi:hypothetical protein